MSFKYTIIIKEDEHNVYLYNTFSGSIIKLDKCEYKNLKNTPRDEKEIHYFNELKSQGFIINEFTNEYLQMKIKANDVQFSDSIK